MTRAVGRCDNDRCTCSPCTCDECRCGRSHLGELEQRVMAVLWSEPGREVGGREVADCLPEYAYTTIATVLDRLSHKGQVRRRRAGRRVLFTAVRTSTAHSAQAMSDVLSAAADVDGTLEDFAASLPAELRDVLRQALERQPCR